MKMNNIQKINLKNNRSMIDMETRGIAMLPPDRTNAGNQEKHKMPFNLNLLHSSLFSDFITANRKE